MPRLEEMELAVSVGNRARDYESSVEKFNRMEKLPYFDQVRYAMGIAYNAEEAGAGKEVMFIGGIGVLGNLVYNLGTDIIPRWRGTKDVDLSLKRRDLTFVTDDVFDYLEESSFRSLSVKNKLNTRGHSHDLNGVDLIEASIDCYCPDNGEDSFFIQNTLVSPETWDCLVESDFFGIPLRAAPISLLLDLKVGISCSQTSRPRDRDCEDILNLLGLAEIRDILPGELKFYLNYNKIDCLKRIVEYSSTRSSEFKHLLVEPSFIYRRYLLE